MTLSYMLRRELPKTKTKARKTEEKLSQTLLTSTCGSMAACYLCAMASMSRDRIATVGVLQQHVTALSSNDICVAAILCH